MKFPSAVKSLSRKYIALAAGYLIFAVAFAQTCYALPVYGSSAQLTGYREVGSGLVGVGNYSQSAVSIGWNIVNNGNGTYNYEYTLSGFDGIRGGGVSHFTLDISDNYDDETIMNATLNGSPISVGKVELGDFREPSNSPIFNIDGAVKFDLGSSNGPLVYAFTSDRAPVWHFAFIKAGAGNFAYTAGLDNPLSDSIFDFIATPNGSYDHEVPEPATALLFGMSTLGLGLMRRRA